MKRLLLSLNFIGMHICAGEEIPPLIPIIYLTFEGGGVPLCIQVPQAPILPLPAALSGGENFLTPAVSIVPALSTQGPVDKNKAARNGGPIKPSKKSLLHTHSCPQEKDYKDAEGNVNKEAYRQAMSIWGTSRSFNNKYVDKYRNPEKFAKTPKERAAALVLKEQRRDKRNQARRAYRERIREQKNKQ